MALRFFKDQALTIPVTEISPLWVMSPLNGNRANANPKLVSLWLGDDSVSHVSVAASAGASTLTLFDTSLFHSTGGVFAAGGTLVTYTSKDTNSLHGVSGLLAAAVNDPVFPLTTFTGSGSLEIWPTGGDLGADLTISLKRPDQSVYGIPGTPVLYSFADTASVNSGGPVALLRVDLSVSVAAGAAREFTDCGLGTTTLTSVETGLNRTAVVSLDVVRLDQGLAQRFRLLNPNRILSPDLAGFEFGAFRWRDESQINQQQLVPWAWDPDTAAIGFEKFIAGYGNGADLAPLSLEKSTDPETPHSIFLRIQNGEYFTGVNRYFLASENSRFQIFLPDQMQFILSDAPAAQKPIFVGNYQIDNEGHYDANIRYRYCAKGFDTAATDPQFILDRATRTITLNQTFSQPDIYLGTAGGAGTISISLPIFPVSNTPRVYLPATSTLAELALVSSCDLETGILTVTFPGGVSGRDFYASAAPGVAVCYQAAEPGDDGSLLIDSVDLNPSFAGISHGFLYLEHRQRRSTLVTLSVDKPRILIPASFEEVSGMVAFGPVYYEDDYAFLQVAVSGSESNDAVPGISLQILPGSDFQGSVNHQDPVASPVIVQTGGDGTASFVYTPPAAYGVYTPTSSASGTHFTLPATILLSQLWNVNDGWLTRLYKVLDDNPVFGKVGADTSIGELPWGTTGTPGTAGYITNGQRLLLTSGGIPLVPVDALDASGVSKSGTGFSGHVKTLVFANALPTDANIGAFFFAYLGQITLSVQALDSGLVSNPILLQLTPPPDSLDAFAGYLILDNSTSGLITSNRLGGAEIVAANVSFTRY